MIPAAAIAASLASMARGSGPWERRRYWLPMVCEQVVSASADRQRAEQQTDEQIARAKARAAADQGRKNARRLALVEAGQIGRVAS